MDTKCRCNLGSAPNSVGELAADSLAGYDDHFAAGGRMGRSRKELGEAKDREKGVERDKEWGWIGKKERIGRKK